MNRPWFAFYAGDWRANSKLRRCTHAERGIWIDVLCLMHDSEEYGVLRWPLKEIAAAVGCRVADLKSLVVKGILKGADAGELCAPLEYTPVTGRKKGPVVVLLEAQSGPIWYSSRMVVDEHKAIRRAGNRDSPKWGFGEGFDAHQSPHQTQHPPRAGVSQPHSQSDNSVERLSQDTHFSGNARDGLTPHGEFAVTLMPLGVGITSMHPVVDGWVQAGFTVQQAVEAVHIARQNKPPPQRIPAKYLDTIIRTEAQRRSHENTSGSHAGGSQPARKPTPVEQVIAANRQFLIDNGIDPDGDPVRG